MASTGSSDGTLRLLIRSREPRLPRQPRPQGQRNLSKLLGPDHPQIASQFGGEVVPDERFELPTNGLQNRCSTAELIRQIRDWPRPKEWPRRLGASACLYHIARAA